MVGMRHLSTRDERTTIIIQTSLPTPDQSCNNAGLTYAIYNNTFYNTDAPKYSSLNIGSFKSMQPIYNGTTDRIGIQPGQPSNAAFSIYDGAPTQLYQFIAVDHKGFLFAPVSGLYTFKIPVSDEITFIWVGGNAISGWTRQNANVEQDYIFQGGTPIQYQVQLQAGTYNPLRIFWANAQGDFAFELEVDAPNGDVIVNGFQANADYLVQFSCDMSTPQFPPWGLET